MIPLKEMMLRPTNGVSGQAYADLMLQQNKLLGKMIGAEIDFIVRGIDSNTRAVVASRRDAMLKKRQTFYMDVDANGMHRTLPQPIMPLGPTISLAPRTAADMPFPESSPSQLSPSSNPCSPMGISQAARLVGP